MPQEYVCICVCVYSICIISLIDIHKWEFQHFFFCQFQLLWRYCLIFQCELLDKYEQWKSEVRVHNFPFCEILFRWDSFSCFFFTFASLFTVPQIYSWVDLVSILQQWLTASEFNQGALFSFTMMNKHEVSIYIIREIKTNPFLYI